MLAVRHGTTADTETAHLYQGLAVILQRANARAILSRHIDADFSATALATASSEAALVADEVASALSAH